MLKQKQSLNPKPLPNPMLKLVLTVIQNGGGTEEIITIDPNKYTTIDLKSTIGAPLNKDGAPLNKDGAHLLKDGAHLLKFRTRGELLNTNKELIMSTM